MGDEEEKEPKRIQTCRLGPRCVSFFLSGTLISMYILLYIQIVIIYIIHNIESVGRRRR